MFKPNIFMSVNLKNITAQALIFSAAMFFLFAPHVCSCCVLLVQGFVLYAVKAALKKYLIEMKRGYSIIHPATCA